MRTKWLTLATAIALLTGTGLPPLFAGGAKNDLPAIAARATSEDAATAAAARAELRGAGYAGLDALFDANADLFRNENLIAPAPHIPEEIAGAWNRFCQAADEVGAQHDDAVSRLYWYKDFESAKSAARAAGKPILSLRLLGNLDEEFSCANSRFFRTTLYPNAEVSKYLRDHFILHWKSVRPVPRITIDFGDGRKLERTITGNSIHYILTPDGQPVDALPGLYGSKAFLRELAAAEQEAVALMPIEGGAKMDHLRQYHRRRLDETENSAVHDAASAGLDISHEDARDRTSALPVFNAMEKWNDAAWTRVAAIHREDAVLDKSSRALVGSKVVPTAAEAGRLALSKNAVESPLMAALHNLERSISVDTVRNEYLLHSRLHEWFASSSPPVDVDQLNSMVYAQLFLMPDSDPWLGLAPADAFTGLDNDHSTPTRGGVKNLSQTLSQLKTIQPSSK